LLSLPYYHFHSHPFLLSFPSRRSSDLLVKRYTDHRRLRLALVVATGRTMDATATGGESKRDLAILLAGMAGWFAVRGGDEVCLRSEEHTSELQSRENLVCRLLLERKQK